jgi:hypothetical protein
LEEKPNMPLEFHLLNCRPEPFTISDIIGVSKWMQLGIYRISHNKFMKLCHLTNIILALSMNMNKEALRMKLMMENDIDLDRLSTLMPPYPTNAPTILNEEDIEHIQFPSLYVHSYI